MGHSFEFFFPVLISGHLKWGFVAIALESFSEAVAIEGLTSTVLHAHRKMLHHSAVTSSHLEGNPYASIKVGK